MKHPFASITKKITRKRVGLSDPRIMHPEREWFIGLAIAISIFFAGAAFSANLYVRNRDVSVTANPAANEEVLYRENLVKDALQQFSSREERLTQLLRGAPAVIPEVLPETEVVTVSETPEATEARSPTELAPDESAPPQLISE